MHSEADFAGFVANEDLNNFVDTDGKDNLNRLKQSQIEDFFKNNIFSGGHVRRHLNGKIMISLNLITLRHHEGSANVSLTYIANVTNNSGSNLVLTTRKWLVGGRKASAREVVETQDEGSKGFVVIKNRYSQEFKGTITIKHTDRMLYPVFLVDSVLHGHLELDCEMIYLGD
jgi:hypothetical protein